MRKHVRVRAAHTHISTYSSLAYTLTRKHTLPYVSRSTLVASEHVCCATDTLVCESLGKKAQAENHPHARSSFSFPCCCLDPDRRANTKKARKSTTHSLRK